MAVDDGIPARLARFDAWGIGACNVTSDGLPSLRIRRHAAQLLLSLGLHRSPSFNPSAAMAARAALIISASARIADKDFCATSTNSRTRSLDGWVRRFHKSRTSSSVFATSSIVDGGQFGRRSHQWRSFTLSSSLPRPVQCVDSSKRNSPPLQNGQGDSATGSLMAFPRRRGGDCCGNPVVTYVVRDNRAAVFDDANPAAVHFHGHVALAV